MAVAVDVILAVSIRSDSSEVRIANFDSKYPSRKFEIPQDGPVDIDASSLEWSNYFKAGMRGACELLQKKNGSAKSVGMDVMASGNVPAGGGLSSSAAFVCASALATMVANGEREVVKKELVELAIVAERAVGVNSGGMDQAASVFAMKDSALRVSFKPELDAQLVSFPKEGPELVFVIAQSLVTADKHTTGPIHYNLRVVECTLAALFLAKIFRLNGLPEDASPLGASLRGFQDAYYEEQEGIADNTKISASDYQSQLEKLVQLTEDYLTQEEGYTRDQISHILQIPIEELEKKYMTKFPIRAEHFKLRQRALHVFNEALRVQQFMNILDSKENLKEVPAQLGALLEAVQDSCRDVYECSCPELDELCNIAKSAGSWGGRLTGAGWGGCSVHLVPKERVEKVKAAWEEKYYRKKFPDITRERLDEAVVVSKPGRGSLVWQAKDRIAV